MSRADYFRDGQYLQRPCQRSSMLNQFIDTTVLNNLTLKVGKKILAFEIKEYE